MQIQPEPGTRARILETARQLFHLRGYEATGIAQILKQAGVNSGSLYHFFKTKEDLLVAVLEQYKDLLWPMVMGPAQHATPDPVERVFAVLGGYRIMLTEYDYQYGCPIGNLAFEVSASIPAARKPLDENFQGWKAAIRAWLEEARPRFNAGTDLDALADYILTIMEGGILLARAKRAIGPWDSAMTMLRDHFNRLLKPKFKLKPTGGKP